MTDELSVQEDIQGVVNFLKNEHELTKLAKALDKASMKAIKFLEEVLADVNADSLRKQQAAEKILTFCLTASKQINDDNMSRLVAQVKLGGGKGRSVTLTDGARPSVPQLDFDTVREV